MRSNARLVVMLGLLGAVSVFGQEAVPLPPPAPLPKTGAPGAAQGGQQAQSGSPLQQLREWLPPFLGGGGGNDGGAGTSLGAITWAAPCPAGGAYDVRACASATAELGMLACGWPGRGA